MRIRKIPWARPALEATSFFVTNPVECIGKWHKMFEKEQELWLELGCGKGGFISKLASSTPDKNFLAIDIKDEVLIKAKAKIEAEYAAVNRPINNVLLTAHEIMIIHKMMNEHDTVGRIFINFPNPWPKNRHKKRRLTHSVQLNQYRTFLVPGGQIWFKTDDLPFFEESLEYFKESGFEIDYLTNDLHKSGFEHNIETEHELMFTSEGKKINFLIARKS